MIFSTILEKIYSSHFYESFANFQLKTVSRWQTNLLKIPAYWKWHSLKYYNAVHWITLLSFTAGLFAGIMLPLSAHRQPGRGEEITIISHSDQFSIVTAYPQLLSADGMDTAEIEIILLDENENPLTNRHIAVTADDERVEISQMQEYTTINGTIYAFVKSTTPGKKVISVTDLDSGKFLEKTTTIEFSEHKVLHWIKPGEISKEGAVSATLETPQEKAYWTTDAITDPAQTSILFQSNRLEIFSCTTMGDLIYCLGREKGQEDNSKLFFFDRINATFEEISSIPISANRAKIIFSDGKLLLFSNDQDENEAYQLDDIGNAWVSIPTSPGSVENYGLISLNNAVYQVGGFNGSVMTSDVYKFEKGQWSKRSDFLNSANLFATTKLNGKIYVFGGWNGTDVLNTAASYSPNTNTWKKISPMPHGRWGHCAAELNDKIYLFGGYDEEANLLETIDVYSPNTNSWEEINTKVKASNCSVCVLDERMAIIGSSNDSVQIVEFTPPQYSIEIDQNEHLRKSDQPSTEISISGKSARGKHVVRKINPLNLSASNFVNLQIYSTKSGRNLQFLMKEEGGQDMKFPFAIDIPLLWTNVKIDISGIPAENRDKISEIGFEIIDATEDFKFNIYDIWTEGEFYTICPCEKELRNIHFAKTDSEKWGRISWSTTEGEASKTTITRKATEGLEWRQVTRMLNLRDYIANNIEFKATLRDEEVSWLPELLSISIEVVEE